MKTQSDPLSLHSIFRRNRLKICFTWLMVLLEAGVVLLFPLAIGYAIDELIAGSYVGVVALAILGAIAMASGAVRRFYDTRVYAGIYARIAPEIVERERDRNKETSVITARASLAREFVEFLENSLPEIINSAFGLIGALLILLFLNQPVFIACIVCSVIIGLIFGLTSNKMYRLNHGLNQELESQVRTIADEDNAGVSSHFKRLTRWSIRLSDLETVNFTLSWAAVMGLLAYSIFAVVQSGATTQGMVFAVLMYVFNYIEAVVALPLFYQQLVRLQEITHRLES